MGKRISLFHISMILLLVVIIFLNLVPMYQMIVNGFKSVDEYNGAGEFKGLGTNTIFPPRKWTLSSFASFMQVPGLPRAFLNTAILAISVIIIVELLGGLTALVLAQYPIGFTGNVVMFFIGAKAIPVVMTMITTFMITRTLHWLDTYQGAIVAFSTQSLPLVLFLFYNYFVSLPRELLDAAEVDGASFFQVFFRIVLPMSSSVLATVGILVFISAWATYLIGLTLLRQQQMYILSMVIKNMTRVLLYKRPIYFAAFFIVSLPTLLVARWAQRYISAGMLAGALKE